jgi:hypothetical protein
LDIFWVLLYRRETFAWWPLLPVALARAGRTKKRPPQPTEEEEEEEEEETLLLLY